MPKTEKVKEIIEICKYRAPGFNDWELFPGASGWGVWATILTGLGILNKEIVCNSLWNNNYNTDSEIMYEKMLSHFLNYKQHFISHNQLIEFIKKLKDSQK